MKKPVRITYRDKELFLNFVVSLYYLEFFVNVISSNSETPRQENGKRRAQKKSMFLLTQGSPERKIGAQTNSSYHTGHLLNTINYE